MKNTKEAHWKDTILPMLPQKLERLLSPIEDEYPLEELRIRAGQPLQLCSSLGDRLLYAAGKRPAATIEDCAAIFERVCGHSIYAWEDEIKNGFVTLAGGCRVGVCGRAVRDERGSIAHISDITSINFRVGRACVGAANLLLPRVLRPDGAPYAALIVSAPGHGKTTILRDMVRQLSYGYGGACPQRVCVIDERMEISGSVRGAPQFDLGPRTDVLCGSGKPEGIRLAVRTLSPQVIATDELGSLQDANAVQEAAFSGVTVIATAHVDSVQALKKRRTLMKLIESGALERIVQLGRSSGRPGIITGVWDGELRPVANKGREVLCFDCSQSLE
ncbi:stage III sporulation protein AA [Eubacteriales bacterium OttesenSCG-928-K08]|nr:stage III sporulation protein AA [Eubacteriales bacterium OttesenSCG-928-K08]